MRTTVRGWVAEKDQFPKRDRLKASPLASPQQPMSHVFLRGQVHQKVFGRSPRVKDSARPVSAATGGPPIRARFFGCRLRRRRWRRAQSTTAGQRGRHDRIVTIMERYRTLSSPQRVGSFAVPIYRLLSPSRLPKLLACSSCPRQMPLRSAPPSNIAVSYPLQSSCAGPRRRKRYPAPDRPTSDKSSSPTLSARLDGAL